MSMFSVLGNAVLVGSSWWSFKWMTTGLATQEGVVRICIFAVALGLFIMLRK